MQPKWTEIKFLVYMNKYQGLRQTWQDYNILILIKVLISFFVNENQ